LIGVRAGSVDLTQSPQWRAADSRRRRSSSSSLAAVLDDGIPQAVGLGLIVGRIPVRDAGVGVPA